MSNKAAGALVLVGLLILLASLLADVGARLIGTEGFGPEQTLSTIVGLVVLVIGVGVWFWRRKSAGSDTEA